MIGSLWKMIELLEKKQNSLLTTVAVCSFCAAVMLTVGIYKGEARAEATKAGGAQSVTVFKPNTQWADKDSGLHLEGEAREGHLDWDLRMATNRALTLREMLIERLEHRQASAAEFEAADLEVRIAVTQLEELQDLLRTKLHMEQEAPTQESKDAISKNVGRSR